MRKSRISPLLFVLGMAALSPLAKAQVSTDLRGSSSSAALPATAPAAQPPPDLPYTKPSQKIKLRNYFFDAYGPYPIVGAAVAAGINQADKTPLEWGQGAQGYGKRFASDLGIAAVTTTTRYALAQALREDTLYYRCACTGLLPRLSHALISTVTARRGEDGHSVFSFSGLVAPYAGTMTAVYGWYPSRFNASDGFRMGNYTLLGYAAGNVALEFFYSGPHSLLARMHLNNRHGAPRQEAPPPPQPDPAQH